jgi:hypothetical protein
MKNKKHNAHVKAWKHHKEEIEVMLWVSQMMGLPENLTNAQMHDVGRKVKKSKRLQRLADVHMLANETMFQLYGHKQRETIH